MSRSSTTQLTTHTAHRATRRNFLQQSARAGLGLGLWCAVDALAFAQGKSTAPTTPDGYFAVPAEAQQEMLKRATFARYNGDFFEAANDYGAPVILNLFKVEDLRAQRDLFAQRQLSESEATQLQEASFALIFRGPLDEPLRQRSYQMKHHALGRLEIFLVPVGKADGARYYEAIFNRSTR